MSLEGKVALVTGASRGIGRAIALALANEGADVACLATTEANAAATAADVQAKGRRSVAVACRVEDGEAVDRAFAQVYEALGSVDILVNNAGFSNPKPVLEMSESDWDSHLAVNSKSVFLCSQAAVSRLVAEGKPGCVINIGSISGENAFPNRLGYCTSKAAVHHMTRIMAIEWAQYGVRVNCVAPGYTMTEMISDLVERDILDVSRLEGRIPQRRLGTPEEIASAVVFLAGDGAAYMTGSVLVIDGGWDAYGHV